MSDADRIAVINKAFQDATADLQRWAAVVAPQIMAAFAPFVPFCPKEEPMTPTDADRRAAVEWSLRAEFKDGNQLAAAIGFLAGVAWERERAAKVAEDARRKVLDNPNDPSWTEHFADLAAAIRRGPTS